MEIANVVFLTHKECDLFNEIASLIFLNNGVNNNIYVELAKKASATSTENERNNIYKEIEKYKLQAKYNTLDDAFKNQ